MDVARAIDAYDKALAVRKDLYEAIFNRGYDLLLLGRYEDADAALPVRSSFAPTMHSH